MKFIKVLLLLCLCFFAQGQDTDEKAKKTFSAKRTNESIRIDGKDLESDWNKAPILTDFTQWTFHFCPPVPLKKIKWFFHAR